ncbi:transcription factor 12 isoform X1 [Tachysurus ichikawai]
MQGERSIDQSASRHSSSRKEDVIRMIKALRLEAYEDVANHLATTKLSLPMQERVLTQKYRTASNENSLTPQGKQVSVKPRYLIASGDASTLEPSSKKCELTDTWWSTPDPSTATPACPSFHLRRKSERPPFPAYGREPGVSGCQSTLRSDMGLASPVTTAGKSPAPFYSFTGSNPRRRSLQDSAPLDPIQTKKVRKVPPGLPSSRPPLSLGLTGVSLRAVSCHGPSPLLLF